MTHYDHRKEESWKDFEFNFPFAQGLKRLREEVLAKTDFDPSVLWVWGTMQAMAVIRILKACEREFGEDGQRVVREALVETGKDIGRQMMEGLGKPEKLSDAEMASFFATVINCIAYASLEDPSIDSEERVSFHILWCPHQDYYAAFDCRVQRYFVQGMLEAVKEKGMMGDWQVRFTQTIPAGAETCHFELWRASDEEKSQWEKYSEQLELKALEIAARDKKEA
jgi:predicted hydrocarbon binding protein